MKTYEYIDEVKRPVLVFNYKTGEQVGEYESITAAAKKLLNNPQKTRGLAMILAKKAKSVACDKLGIRITVKYKS